MYIQHDICTIIPAECTCASLLFSYMCIHWLIVFVDGFSRVIVCGTRLTVPIGGMALYRTIMAIMAGDSFLHSLFLIRIRRDATLQKRVTIVNEAGVHESRC